MLIERSAPVYRRRSGLSMVEAMIALAITAMLLTAVGAAFTSSAKAMEINDQFFRASQGARVAVNRIMTQARRGTVSEKDAYDQITNLTDNQTVTYIRLITPIDPADLTKVAEYIYKFDSTAKELQMYRVVNNVIGAKNVLAKDVIAGNFVIGIGKDANNAKCVSRLAMSITIQEGNNIIRLSGNAVPRGTMTY